MSREKSKHREILEDVLEVFEDNFGTVCDEEVYHKFNEKHEIFYNQDGNLKMDYFDDASERILSDKGITRSLIWHNIENRFNSGFDDDSLAIPKGDLDIAAFDFGGKESEMYIVEIKSNGNETKAKRQLKKAREHFSEYVDEIKLYYKVDGKGLKIYEPD